jgi:hypothetical protein
MAVKHYATVHLLGADPTQPEAVCEGYSIEDIRKQLTPYGKGWYMSSRRWVGGGAVRELWRCDSDTIAIAWEEVETSK